LAGPFPETPLKEYIRTKIRGKAIDKPEMPMQAKLFLENIYRPDVKNLKNILLFEYGVRGELMSLEDLRNQTFPAKTKEDWKVIAEESLKGKSIESLQSITYENITLKPLYSQRDEQTVPDFPGGSDFRRGVYPIGYVTNNWKIAQQLRTNTPSELKVKLQEAIDKGQTALSFEVSKDLLETKEFLDEVVTDLSDKYPFAINGKDLQSAFLAELIEFAGEGGKGGNIFGYVANDLISLFAENGFISLELLTKWTEDIKTASRKLPNLRTVLIDTSSYHQGGSNAVQELGIAAATGTFYLQHLLETGMKLEDVLSKMVFHFSLGSNFFMELAKLRAARILWNKITEVYGAESKYRGMEISAQTSPFTKTVYDPYVNILRAGNEAFAAVLGGIQYLHVTPFDDIIGTSQLSERIARNTQNILKEEAHLQKVADPAGGSWYVEKLTIELAEKAWEYFQKIEENGGFIEVLKSNWLQNEIKAINEKRQQDIFTRKQSIIGTNVYANLDEETTAGKEQSYNRKYVHPYTSIKIEAISRTRLSEPYEELRKKAEELERKIGTEVFMGILCLGELKQYKARLDFMKGFLSAGGVRTQESGSITSYETARQFVISKETKYFCLCGSNVQYDSLGHEILSALSAEFPDRIFYLAGLPENEHQPRWIDEGIKQFIHLKSNCYETLSSILTEMEVSFDEVTKA
jgi:methylmalonyl-CoA mutase